MFVAAQSYKKNLCNKNLLFIYKTHPNKYEFIEAVFLPKHFRHLTGVKTSKEFRSVDFYNRCLDKKLSVDDFDLASDGTTWIKKDVLPHIMNIHYMSNIFGDYNESKPKLFTEKLTGNTRGCLGFVPEQESPGFYAPNTVIKEDIRGLVKKPCQLVLVFSKEKDDGLYKNLTYSAKGFEYETIIPHKNISRKLASLSQIVKLKR